MMAGTLIVGVGQRLRRDDAAGLVVAGRLQARGTPARVITCETNCLELADEFAGADMAIVIDAMSSGRPPGTIDRFDVHEAPLPASRARSSTHAFGVADAIELARALGRLPAAMTVFGIEGADFAVGEGLSPAVDAAVDMVVSQIAAYAEAP